ncbi:hypothetical protein H0H87_004016 [Tephrocybe sp. NHM501043]|nr:hypothetical protein H0H87_004016 [Tephrocybe sp. NHM501043]
MSAPTGALCFASNPEVTGIGVRAAIYAQNLLSFAPALLALRNRNVTPAELEVSGTQSTTTLITTFKFAILVSTVIQAHAAKSGAGISNYHTSIVLNLSWMNNTYLFIYLLLYTYRRVNLPEEELDLKARDHLPTALQHQRRVARLIYEAKKAAMNPVVIMGSLHLSLMAAVGIWLWSNPAHFGGPPVTCPNSLSASVFIVGTEVPLGSARLRAWSILIYSILLIPLLNLLIPMALFSLPLFLHWHQKQVQLRRIMIVLGMLGVIDVILLTDTEVGIKKNLEYGWLGKDEGQWSFGQTLALLLLLVPLRDLWKALWERPAKSLGQRLKKASAAGKEVVEDALDQGPKKIALGMHDLS